MGARSSFPVLDHLIRSLSVLEGPGWGLHGNSPSCSTTFLQAPNHPQIKKYEEGTPPPTAGPRHVPRRLLCGHWPGSVSRDPAASPKGTRSRARRSAVRISSLAKWVDASVGNETAGFPTGWHATGADGGITGSSESGGEAEAVRGPEHAQCLLGPTLGVAGNEHPSPL